MKWGAMRSALAPWLRRGMGVKRWLCLLTVSILLFSLAVSALLHAMGMDVWLTAAGGLWHLLPNTAVQALLLLTISGIVIAGSVYSLNQSLLAAFRRRDQAEVHDVVYRFRQRQRGPGSSPSAAGTGCTPSCAD